MSIQTHNGNELVGKIPRQQLIGGFSGCASCEDNAGEDCMGGWLKSMSDVANNSPPEIASTRFLPRNGLSTRYPARNPPGMLAILWMSC
jgi:hypothetical protein